MDVRMSEKKRVCVEKIARMEVKRSTKFFQ